MSASSNNMWKIDENRPFCLAHDCREQNKDTSCPRTNSQRPRWLNHLNSDLLVSFAHTHSRVHLQNNYLFSGQLNCVVWIYTNIGQWVPVTWSTYNWNVSPNWIANANIAFEDAEYPFRLTSTHTHTHSSQPPHQHTYATMLSTIAFHFGCGV